MAEQLPPPPVPADCDLRGMEWLPLYGGRLFGSDFDAHASDAEFRAGMQLWWAAWNQVPASSLPDDDVALCRLAGFGRDLKGWKRVKARATHGFYKCSDGRLYHRALATFAQESWDRRLKDRERKAKWREQRERKTERDKGRDGTVPETGTETVTERGRDEEQGCDGTADAMRCDETRRDATSNYEEPNGSSDTTAPPGDGLDIPAGLKRAKSPARGSRLPDGWQPGPELEQFARELGLDPVAVTAEFADYWRGVPGAKGVKLDWDATFRNRCRELAGRNGLRGVRRPQDRPSPNGTGRMAVLHAVSERFRREEDEQP